jgi:copper chaperone
MSCEHCVNAVKSALENVGGTISVEVSLELGQADISLHSTDISNSRLIEAVEKAGYKASE